MVFKKWYQVMYRTGNEPIVFLFHQRFLFLWPLPTSKGTLKRVIQSCFAFFYNEADTFLNSCLNSLLLPLNLHPAIWFEIWTLKNLSGSDNPDFFQVGNLKNQVPPSKILFRMQIKRRIVTLSDTRLQRIIAVISSSDCRCKEKMT